MSIRVFTVAAFMLFLPAALSSVAKADAFPATPEDLRGMASLTCSGALVRLGRGADQPAVLLTNGHCARAKMIDPEDALVDAPYERGSISIYVGTESPVETTPTRVLYATMTGTDLALVELRSTYRDLEAKGARIYEIADVDAKVDSSVQIISGYWKEKQLCGVSHIVESLAEDAWTYRNAIALREPCPVQGGWSGTPLLDSTTSAIVGIISKSNAAGGLCTLDNPCEVLKGGERLAFHGRTYATRVSPVLACLTSDGDIDLDRRGCKLQKPKNPPQRRPAPTPSPTATAKPSSKWPRR